jgi:2-isopropylmalate synthase
VLDPAAICHANGTEIVLGKLSGRARFVARARALGFQLTDERLERAFASFQVMADSKREVGDEDLRAICEAA